jgi:hypothetical protein
MGCRVKTVTATKIPSSNGWNGFRNGQSPVSMPAGIWPSTFRFGRRIRSGDALASRVHR